MWWENERSEICLDSGRNTFRFYILNVFDVRNDHIDKIRRLFKCLSEHWNEERREQDREKKRTEFPFMHIQIDQF